MKKKGRLPSSKQVSNRGYDPYNKPATKKYKAPKATNYNDPYNNAGPKVKASSRGKTMYGKNYTKGNPTNVNKAGSDAFKRTHTMTEPDLYRSKVERGRIVSTRSNTKPQMASQAAREGMMRKNAARAAQVAAKRAAGRVGTRTAQTVARTLVGGKFGAAGVAAAAGYEVGTRIYNKYDTKILDGIDKVVNKVKKKKRK